MDLISRPQTEYMKSTLEDIEHKVDVSHDLIDLFLKSFAETQAGDVTADKLLKSYGKLYIMLTGAQQVLDGIASIVNQLGTYLERFSA